MEFLLLAAEPSLNSMASRGDSPASEAARLNWRGRASSQGGFCLSFCLNSKLCLKMPCGCQFSELKCCTVAFRSQLSYPNPKTSLEKYSFEEGLQRFFEWE